MIYLPLFKVYRISKSDIDLYDFNTTDYDQKYEWDLFLRSHAYFLLSLDIEYVHKQLVSLLCDYSF